MSATACRACGEAYPPPDHRCVCSPDLVRPGVRVVRRGLTWGVETRRDGRWCAITRSSKSSASGRVRAWWFTREGAVEAARRLEP